MYHTTPRKHPIELHHSHMAPSHYHMILNTCMYLLCIIEHPNRESSRRHHVPASPTAVKRPEQHRSAIQQVDALIRELFMGQRLRRSRWLRARIDCLSHFDIMGGTVRYIMHPSPLPRSSALRCRPRGFSVEAAPCWPWSSPGIPSRWLDKVPRAARSER